ELLGLLLQGDFLLWTRRFELALVQRQRVVARENVKSRIAGFALPADDLALLETAQQDGSRPLLQRRFRLEAGKEREPEQLRGCRGDVAGPAFQFDERVDDNFLGHG